MIAIGLNMALALIIIPILLLFPITSIAAEKSFLTSTELASIRDIGGHAKGAISVSPDGKWVAFQLQVPKISRGEFEYTWITVSTKPNGSAFAVADGGSVLLNPRLHWKTNGNRLPIRAVWSPDSKRFAYLLRRGQNNQIWISPRDRKEQIQITHGSADVIDFMWAKDGSKLYFETGLSDAAIAEKYEQEASSGFLYDDRFQATISTLPIQTICDVINDEIRAVSLARRCKPQISVYNFGNKELRKATETEVDEYSSLRSERLAPEIADRGSLKKIRRWRSSNQFAWLENEDSSIFRGPYAPLRLHAIVDGEVKKCSDFACLGYSIRGHQDLWWNSSGHEVIFVRRDSQSHSMTGVYAWTPTTGETRTIYQSEDWLSECAFANERLICLHESWTTPRKIVSLSLANGKITTIYDPNPEFADRQFTQIEKIEWKDDFGNPTHGHLVYPSNYESGKLYPLVIVTYQSRGFLRGGIGDEYPIHPLAAEGFFVLSHEMPFDLQLAGSKEHINDALYDNLYIRKSVLSSQEKIAHDLVSKGLVDAERIAITGLSEGMSQTAYALIHSDLFAVAISSSGTDKSPSVYYQLNRQTRKFWRVLLNGAPEISDSYWQELSPGLNVDQIHAPLLLNVADSELIVSLEDFVRLQDANKPIEMYVFPEEYHVKWRPNHRLAIYRRNVQWLKFWLLGQLERQPVVRNQYNRWSQLCQQHIGNLISSNDPNLIARAHAQPCVKLSN